MEINSTYKDAKTLLGPIFRTYTTAVVNFGPEVALVELEDESGTYWTCTENR